MHVDFAGVYDCNIPGLFGCSRVYILRIWYARVMDAKYEALIKQYLLCHINWYKSPYPSTYDLRPYTAVMKVLLLILAAAGTSIKVSLSPLCYQHSCSCEASEIYLPFDT
jgi:hypothetical protein